MLFRSEAVGLFFDYRAGRRALDAELFTELERWLLDHIADDDRELGRYLAAFAAAHPDVEVAYSVAELGAEPPPIPEDHPAAAEA